MKTREKIQISRKQFERYLDSDQTPADVLEIFCPLLTDYKVIHCPNCGDYLLSKKQRVYCSPECQKQAKTIRYREKKGIDET